MTRYAVGDLQGCLQPLECLLERVAFNPQQDQLWLVGDLVNRGPQSLQTLRFVKQLGHCTRIVLGNHDLHFLAIAYGVASQSRSDTLTPILQAPDCNELVQWLRQQPLLYTDPSGDYTMTHAGIPPIWNLQQAKKYATEVETVLQSDQIEIFLRIMYGNTPDCWNEKISGWDRIRLITNYFTRMRFCTANGKLDLTHKEATIEDSDYSPWFSHPQQLTKTDKLVFGHWASLQGKVDAPNIYALDTGCVWGGSLTMMNLDNKDYYSCQCDDH